MEEEEEGEEVVVAVHPSKEVSLMVSEASTVEGGREEVVSVIDV